MTSPANISHPELVAALVKPGAAICAELNDRTADLWHAATGICGEAGEILEATTNSFVFSKALDMANLVEELGDSEFYIEQMRQNLGITRSETKRYPYRVCAGLFEESVLLSIAASSLLDVTKKVVLYNKPIVIEAFVDALGAIECALQNIRDELEVTRDDTLVGNISKLSIRYGSLTYSDNAAQTRADKA